MTEYVFPHITKKGDRVKICKSCNRLFKFYQDETKRLISEQVKCLDLQRKNEQLEKEIEELKLGPSFFENN